MSVVTVGKYRVYARKFDHDEARRRHAAGETIAALAREYCVVDQAVRRVVMPGVEERMRAATKMAYTATCEVCGGPCLSHRHPAKRTSRDLCRVCSGRLSRNQTRPGDDGMTCVRCFGCHEWKPVTAFSPRVGQRLRDGLAIRSTSCCSACMTKARQDYRERHKVPCSVCGAACLPPNEKRTNGASVPRCRKCFYAARRKKAA